VNAAKAAKPNSARSKEPSRSQLLRGLQVLEELATEAVGAAEVARRIQVNRSTALRTLIELQEAGYVKRDDRSKAFSLRPERFYSLIANQPDHRRLMDILNPVLAALSDASGEASMYAAPANGMMVYVAYHPSPSIVTISERVGAVRHMNCSAVGKAYLSALDPAALDQELGRLDYTGGTKEAAQGPIELRARIQAARSVGYALDREETFADGSCVAAPLHLGGRLIGAVGISGPSVRLTLDRLEELGNLIVSQMHSLSGFIMTTTAGPPQARH
jgi:DNA-binding IclR family transcriptional regulator